jgi:hypothetical protein
MKLQSSDTYGGDAKPGALVVGVPAIRVGKMFLSFFFQAQRRKKNDIPRWRLPMHTSFLKIYWPLIQLSYIHCKSLSPFRPLKGKPRQNSQTPALATKLVFVFGFGFPFRGRKGLRKADKPQNLTVIAE